MKNPHITHLTLLTSLLWTLSANAEVPKILHYQGVLSDSAGIPVHCLTDGSCDDTYSMSFALYAQAEGGQALFTQEETAVSISEGGGKVSNAFLLRAVVARVNENE